MQFYFNFVFPYHSELEIGNLKPSLHRINQSFVHLASKTYEDVACDILRGHKRYLFDFFKIGRWWHKENEIDVIALDEFNKNILFAEVKWSKKMVGTDIYRNLLGKSEIVDWPYQKAHYAILSRSGFTKGMISLAQKENLLLIKGDRIDPKSR